MLLSAMECRTNSETCRLFGVAPKISLQQAAIYLAMANSWTTLAGQKDQLSAIVKVEGGS
jgi:hypothetical protein